QAGAGAVLAMATSNRCRLGPTLSPHCPAIILTTPLYRGVLMDTDRRRRETAEPPSDPISVRACPGIVRCRWSWLHGRRLAAADKSQIDDPTTASYIPNYCWFPTQ